MKKFLFYLSLLLSSFSYAVVSGPVEVSGTVVNVDKNSVTLKPQKGQGKGKFKVPRKRIPPKYKISYNKPVKAFLTIEEFNKILRDDYKKSLASQKRAKKKRIKSKRGIASQRSKKRDAEPEIENTGLEHDH